MNDENAATSGCQILVNGEGQYSLWPADRVPPRGWSQAGPQGTREECLSYIEEAWSDMTPRSLQRSRGEPRVAP